MRACDLSGRKILIENTKSGREAEFAFMPEHISSRLAEYVASKELSPDDRVFPLCYTTVGTWSRDSGKS